MPIGTGKITPFAKLPDDVENEEGLPNQDTGAPLGVMSHQHLRMPGFLSQLEGEPEASSSTRSVKRRRLIQTPQGENYSDAGDGVDGLPDTTDVELSNPSDDYGDGMSSEGSKPKARKRKTKDAPTKKEDLSSMDDGNEKQYRSRLNKWVSRRREARDNERANISELEVKVEESIDDPGEEWNMPHPSIPDLPIDGQSSFNLPGDIHPSLFDYQRTCVQWLWELHKKRVGGIIGDEMGLGKTIQLISFIAGLHYSKHLDKPVIVVAPATVLKQWVDEFHKWWPPLRVAILHSSGSGMLDLKAEEDYEESIEDLLGYKPTKKKAHSGAEKIVSTVFKHGKIF